MNLQEVINKCGEDVKVCIRSGEYDAGSDEVKHFYKKALPILRKHNVQTSFHTNANGLNGVWLDMSKYVLSRPGHGVKNWGFEHEALLELCQVCDVKISIENYNYILDKGGNVEEVVEGE